MANKKGKALALELIDDLLNDSSEDSDNSPAEAEKIQSPSSDVDVFANGDVDMDMDMESDKTVDLSAMEAFPPTPQHASKHIPEHRPEHMPEDATVPLAPAERVVDRVGPVTPRHEHEDRTTRTSVGRHAALRSGAPNATEAALAQSESLRIAQNRILELEQELERIRIQNEELGAAGETLRRRTDELLSLNSRRESDYQNAVSTFDQEKEILTGSKEAMSRELDDLRRRNEELELRISSNIQKIRVRERELENRLELVKMESAALIRSKDEIILESKRQIDQLNMELGNYRNKNQELNRLTSDKQEMLRRTVKALRLALSMLEGEEEPLAKATPLTPLRKVK